MNGIYDESFWQNGNSVLKLMALAIKQGLFLAAMSIMTVSARKRPLFLAGRVAKKKETPSKGCLRKYLVMRFLGYARNDIDQITY